MRNRRVQVWNRYDCDKEQHLNNGESWTAIVEVAHGNGIPVEYVPLAI